MTPNFEEILERDIVDYRNNNTILNGYSWIEYETALDKLKEVWNAAIEEAAENAVIKQTEDKIIDLGFGTETRLTIEVDKDSILKLKIE